MMTHTKGPWRVRTEEITTNLVVSPPGDCAICEVFPQYDADGNARYDMYANARLIAAAPELLEACKAALKIADEYFAFGLDGFIAEYQQIQSAIAKAEGQL